MSGTPINTSLITSLDICCNPLPLFVSRAFANFTTSFVVVLHMFMCVVSAFSLVVQLPLNFSDSFIPMVAKCL